MATIESNAVFRGRGVSMGLPSADLDIMQAKGWTTYATFAFASSYIPGQGDDAQFRTDVVEAVTGSPSHPKAAVLRRLYFESYTLTAADLKARVERTGDEPPRKIPAPERAARFRALAAKLPGLDLTSRAEPSNHLVDMFNQMLEEGQLKYVGWDESSSRMDELQGLKRSREWRPDGAGHLREITSEVGPKADVSSDLKVSQALARRGVAMELANLMEVQNHELIAKLLLKEYQREPPSGFQRVSLDQLQRADREIWSFMADRARDGLVTDSMGARPLDRLVRLAVVDPTVLMLLLPLAGSSLKRPADTAKASTDELGQPLPKAPKKTPKGKGKGKGKDHSRGPGNGQKKERTAGHLPGGLKGSPFTKDGEPICFNYNLQRCSVTTTGSCPKGKHECTLCHGAHPFRLCPGKGQ